eukprot:6224722-Pyramimonas_sp.AAC.1
MLHPWARQWIEDTRALHVFDDGLVLLAKGPSEVILNGREDFCRLDVSGIAAHYWSCLLYTSDAADDTPCVDL